MHGRTLRTRLLVATLASAASAQVVEYRAGRWADASGKPIDTFVVVRWSRPWSHAEAALFADSVGAHLASLPTAESLAHATQLCIEPAFWQCAGPWIEATREASQPWRWSDGEAIDHASWATGRPAQPSGLPAHTLLAGEGEPSGGITDALDADFGQPVTSSAILRWSDATDCDGDVIPDAFEIALDASLDADSDGRLDRCASRNADLDGSGMVDFGDVAIAMLDFGTCPACPADLDGSGTVDFGDIALLLLSFGTAGVPR